MTAPRDVVPDPQRRAAAAPVVETQYATGEVRDQFLVALDDGEQARMIGLALRLAACRNPLPSVTCTLLGLPDGSSYGAAARAILAGVPKPG